MIEKLCMPALIYLIYSTSHVIIDTYKGMYNTAFVEVWQAILFTFLLNLLCQNGLSLVSWLLVSIPFILMTVIASVLLLVFGLNPATGKAVYTAQAPATPSRYAVPITVETPVAVPTAAPSTATCAQASSAVNADLGKIKPPSAPPFHGVLGKDNRPRQSNTT